MLNKIEENKHVPKEDFGNERKIRAKRSFNTLRSQTEFGNAKALCFVWIPAFAGMTKPRFSQRFSVSPFTSHLSRLTKLFVSRFTSSRYIYFLITKTLSWSCRKNISLIYFFICVNLCYEKINTFGN
jgi:hypothetical protein